MNDIQTHQASTQVADLNREEALQQQVQGSRELRHDALGFDLQRTSESIDVLNERINSVLDSGDLNPAQEAKLQEMKDDLFELQHSKLFGVEQYAAQIAAGAPETGSNTEFPSFNSAVSAANSANAEVVEIGHRFDRFVDSLDRQAPSELLSKVDQALTAVNEEIGSAEMQVAEWNLQDTDIDNHQIGHLEQDFKDLLKLKSELISPEFEELSNNERSRLIDDAEVQVSDTFDEIIQTREMISDAINGHAEHYENATAGFKAIRDATVSMAQAGGTALLGPFGGAVGGYLLTSITRQAADIGVDLTAVTQNLTSEETAQLRQQTEALLGPAWADFVAGAGAPLIDGKVMKTGDFVAAFSTTFVTELQGGASVQDAFSSALAQGARAQGIGMAGGAVVDGVLK